MIVMCQERVARIRGMVEYVRVNEESSRSFRKSLEPRIPSLHKAIRLPETGAVPALTNFVVHYVEQVADFVEAITDITHEAGIYQEVKPLLRIACDYFINPPGIVRNPGYIGALLEEAYLAHRLLEEINDRFISQCGIPLAPIDMTRANIIAHELIGEPFANELDQAVLFSAELLLDKHRFAGKPIQQYVQQHKRNGWDKELSRWPCLTDSLDIDVSFSQPRAKVTH